MMMLTKIIDCIYSVSKAFEKVVPNIIKVNYILSTGKERRKPVTDCAVK